MRRPDRSIIAIIAINVLVFLLWNRWDPVFMSENFVVSPNTLFSGRFWTLITSAFSHYDTTHLLFNMLTFYFFGRVILRTLGEQQLLILYFGGALVSALAHVAFSLVMGESIGALGASGSVMAISVMFACLYPRQTILLGFFIPVPAAVAVGLFILFDLVGMGASGTMGAGSGSAVAHAAHLGGAAFGFTWFRFIRRSRDRAAVAFEEYYDRQQRRR